MTDKVKSRLRAIPVLVCSLGCVALAIPTAVSAVKADTTTPITSNIGYSTPISLSQLGTWEIGMYYTQVPNATSGPARNIQFSVPLYNPIDNWQGYGEQYNNDNGGYVNILQEYNYSNTGYEYYIGDSSGLTPTDINYLPSATFTTGSFALSVDDFEVLCENTVISLPVGVFYNVHAYFRCIDTNSVIRTYVNDGGLFFTTIGETVSGTPAKTMYDALGGFATFRDLPKIDGTLVVVEMGFTITADRFVGTSRSPNVFAMNCTFDPNIQVGTIMDNYDFYADYVAGRYAPQPTAGETLLSPLTAFFETELFDGFTMGSLLVIALGCLLFGLFLKIFVGG